MRAGVERILEYLRDIGLFIMFGQQGAAERRANVVKKPGKKKKPVVLRGKSLSEWQLEFEDVPFKRLTKQQR